MIRSYRHKGLQQFAETGSKAGIQPAHIKKLTVQLFNGNWRLTFKFEGEDVVLLDYQDNH